MTVAIAPAFLRSMTIADIPRVAEIERASFPTSWPQSAYRRELERPSLSRYIVAVERAMAAGDGGDERGRGPFARLGRWLAGRSAAPATGAERIVGFLGMWFLVDEAHIVTVAVEEAARRRGIGEMLVARAIELARERGAETVTLEVRVSNTGAQALYEKYGFARAGIRKRYYTDNGEDALIMTTPAISDPVYGERLAELHRRYVERHGQVRVDG